MMQIEEDNAFRHLSFYCHLQIIKKPALNYSAVTGHTPAPKVIQYEKIFAAIPVHLLFSR